MVEGIVFSIFHGPTRGRRPQTVYLQPWFWKFMVMNPHFCLQDQSFLEDVNILLNSADIPNLYENEERLEIIEKVCFTSIVSEVYFTLIIVSWFTQNSILLS